MAHPDQGGATAGNGSAISTFGHPGPNEWCPVHLAATGARIVRWSHAHAGSLTTDGEAGADPQGPSPCCSAVSLTWGGTRARNGEGPAVGGPLAAAWRGLGVIEAANGVLLETLDDHRPVRGA